MKTTPTPAYRLRVTLRDVRPEVWRLLDVPGRLSLEDLHLVLQLAFGWENRHLYAFDTNGFRYEPRDEDVENEGLLPDAPLRLIKVDDVAEEGVRITYEYDFGDCWIHDIEIEKVLPPEEAPRFPTCIDGSRSAPPEDCGGVSGFHEILRALQIPSAKDEELLDWLGSGYDPEKFDIAAVNDELRSRDLVAFARGE